MSIPEKAPGWIGQVVGLTHNVAACQKDITEIKARLTRIEEKIQNLAHAVETALHIQREAQTTYQKDLEILRLQLENAILQAQLKASERPPTLPSSVEDGPE